MKYIILLGDGMADFPVKELNGKTPLMAANTPHMDFIARNGVVGMVKTIPEGFAPGSDVAALSILGYPPQKYYRGRGPFEAANQGIDFTTEDVVFRCNLVTLADDKSLHKSGEKVMDDFSAGHISTDEGQALIAEIQKRLGNDEFHFYPGVSYRHLMVWKNGKDKMKLTPPHDISGKSIKPYLPTDEESLSVMKLMQESQKFLPTCAINQQRISQGKKPANSIWLWGQGKKVGLPSFQERFGLNGAIISAVDLIKGIGVLIRLTPLKVPGVTGYLDTNYQGKVEYALAELKKNDFVFLHVEAPDEAGHNGILADKLKAIEDFDSLVVGPILNGMKQFIDYRVMVLCDHPTPISIRTHTADPVPFAIFSPQDKLGNNNLNGYNEGIGKFDNKVYIEIGDQLINFFLKGDKNGEKN